MISSKDKRGITLVELMVVMLVLSIIMGLIYSIFISQMQSSTWRGQLAERGQNLKAAMNLMVADLMKAGSIENTPGICNSAISMKIGSETITYSRIVNDTTWCPPPGQCLFRDSSVANKDAVVADNIIDLDFDCYDRTGALMNAGGIINAAAVSDVRRVAATITGETRGSRPGTTAKSEESLTSSVELRNIPQYAGSGCGVLYFNLTPSSVAFCTPPGDRPTISIKLCDLTGNALGGNVSIYPREPQPVTITGTGGTVVSQGAGGTAVMTVPTPASGTTCDNAVWGTAIVNATNEDALDPGIGIEMVTVWRPANCDYDISTSRSLSVKAGHPVEFEANALGITPGVINACQSSQTASLSAKVMDSCGHVITGVPVTIAVDGMNPSPGDGDMGSVAGVAELGSGAHVGTYTASDHSGTVTLKATASNIWNATSQTLTGTTFVTNTITLNPDAPIEFEKVSAPFSLSPDECPGESDSLTFKVLDGCGNPISGQAGSLNASLDPIKGSVHTEVDSLDVTQYLAIYNTPDACGDGNMDATLTIGHSLGFTNTASIDLRQCPMPGLDVTRTSAAPHRVARGCSRTDDPNNPIVTVRAEVRSDWAALAPPHDPCDPWPVSTKFEFEVINPDSGASFNGKWLDADTTWTTTTASGWAERTLLGLNPGTVPNPPAVGDNLKVRAKAWVKYDPVTGAYDTLYYDGANGANYNDLAVNLVEVVAPTVSINFFTDGTYSAAKGFISADCSDIAPDTVYFQVDDCDADLTAPVTAVVNSIAPDGSTRDTETLILTGGGGIYNGSIATRVSSGGMADDGTLKIASADEIKVFYTDATDSSVDTATINTSRGFDDFEGDVSGWTITGSHVYPPNPGWHTTTISGDKWFAYNDGTDFQPADFLTNEGSLTSPEFAIDTSAGTYLVFNSMHEVECTTLNTCFYDTRYVFINSTSAPAWRLIEPVAADETAARSVATKTYNLSHPHRVGIDLSTLPAADYDGKTGKLLFKFKTWDGAINQYDGWFVDDVSVTCSPDVTPPAAPVIAGTTLSSTKVRLTWPAVADAAGYSVFVFNFDRTGRPDAVAQNIAQNCVSAGSVCYEYTAPSLLGTSWYFRVAAFDAAGNLSTLSNSYRDTTDTILDISMTCYAKAASTLVGGKKKYVVNGAVTNLDGSFIGAANAAFSLTTASAGPDLWNLTTSSAVVGLGTYCGDNETDGTASPFGGEAITASSMQASKAGYTSSAVKVFANAGACSCAGDPCAPTAIAYPSGAIAGSITTTCLSTSRTANGTHYAKYYTFTLAAPANVTITMTGSDPIYDTYLYLLDSSYNVITFNDDFSGLDSQIGPWALGAGTYIIEATTYYGSALPNVPDDTTGNFTLSLF